MDHGIPTKGLHIPACRAKSSVFEFQIEGLFRILHFELRVRRFQSTRSTAPSKFGGSAVPG